MIRLEDLMSGWKSLSSDCCVESFCCDQTGDWSLIGHLSRGLRTLEPSQPLITITYWQITRTKHRVLKLTKYYGLLKWNFLSIKIFRSNGRNTRKRKRQIGRHNIVPCISIDFLGISCLMNPSPSSGPGRTTSTCIHVYNL